MLHLALHFLVPAGLAIVFFRKNWKLAFCWMMVGMLIDVDHLLANPIYDPGRCSIGFHPLHELWFIALYAVLCILPKTRFLGIGLVIHIALDAVDCQLGSGIWIS